MTEDNICTSEMNYEVLGVLQAWLFAYKHFIILLGNIISSSLSPSPLNLYAFGLCLTYIAGK